MSFLGFGRKNSESTTPQIDNATSTDQPAPRVDLTPQEALEQGLTSYYGPATTPEPPYEDLQGPKTKPFEPIVDAPVVEGQSQWAENGPVAEAARPDEQPPIPPTTMPPTVS